MNDLIIKQGKFSPEVQFLASGSLKITGRSILKYSSELYADAINWLREFDKLKHPALTLNLSLDALDTASVRCMVELVRTLNNFINCEKIKINWCYEKFDEDLMDIGSAIQQLSKVEFNLLEVENEA